MTKHLIIYLENSLLVSANLTLSMVNNITPILGLIRHLTNDNIMNEKFFDYLSKEPQFLSVINRLLEKWPGMSVPITHLIWL